MPSSRRYVEHVLARQARPNGRFGGSSLKLHVERVIHVIEVVGVRRSGQSDSSSRVVDMSATGIP
jgi:hypothetical protein